MKRNHVYVSSAIVCLLSALILLALAAPVSVTPTNIVLKDGSGGISVTTVYCASVQNSSLDSYVQVYRMLVQNGSSFPAVASSGFLFFRTDWNVLTFYNGTDWTNCTGGGVSGGPYLLASEATNLLFTNGTQPLTADWNTGAYGVYGMSWINSSAINLDQLWWQNQNRTDLLAHPQDSYNFLVWTEGGVVYARTGNTGQCIISTIQACIDYVSTTPWGGSIIVKNGTYSEAVVLKNATRLVIDKGALGITMSIAASATAIYEDYNTFVQSYYYNGVLVYSVNSITGAVTGDYGGFQQFFVGSWATGWLNRTDAVANPIATASYIIDVSGSNYRMKNGTTGQFDFVSTNASAAITNAIGNMSSGMVFVKTGTYIVTSTMTINKSAIGIIGEGYNTLFNVTDLSDSDVDCFRLWGSSGNILNGLVIKNIRIAGLRPNTTAHGGDGINLQYVDNVLISENWIQSVGEEGIFGTYCYNCTIEKNVITNCGSFGIELREAANNNRISGNTLTRNGFLESKGELGLDSPSAGHLGNIITNNVIVSLNGTYVIELTYADRDQIIGNSITVELANGQAIRIDGYSTETIIQGNMFIANPTGGGRAGVSLASGLRTIITANQFVGFTDGVIVNGGANIIVDGNFFSQGTADAIHQAGTCSAWIISNNVMTGRTNTLVAGASSMRNNVGFVTENSVSGANTTATTAIIAHGLTTTATYVWCSFNTSAITGYTWSSNSTYITITPAGTLPASWTCYAKVEYVP